MTDDELTHAVSDLRRKAFQQGTLSGLWDVIAEVEEFLAGGGTILDLTIVPASFVKVPQRARADVVKMVQDAQRWYG